MRQRLIYLAFLVLPLAVYFPVILNEYGQAADFAMLSPDKAGAGAPAAAGGEPVFYRALLESSFAAVDGVSSLWVVRILSVLLLSLLGILVWRQLDGCGWPWIDAAAAGMLVILLPAAQVLAAWAFSWPHILAALCGLAGFAAVEAELEAGGLKRVIAMLGGAFIYALATITRPELAFFAIVPLAGGLLIKVRKTPSTHSAGTWLVLHAAVMFAGWLAGRLFEHGVSGDSFATAGGVQQAVRWYFLDALPGSIALFPLLDDHHVGAWYFWPIFLAMAAAIAWVFRLEQELDGAKARAKVRLCFVVLPLMFLAGVVLSGRIVPTGYREAYPLAGLVAVALCAGWQTVLRSGKIKKWGHSAGLGGIIALAAILAHWNTQTLLAGPRAEEWRHLRAALAPVTFNTVQRVHVIAVDEDDRATARAYGDEFGAVASMDESVLRQMVAAAIRERFPAGFPRGGGAEITVSTAEPPAGTYDVLVDMRTLRRRGG